MRTLAECVPERDERTAEHDRRLTALAAEIARQLNSAARAGPVGEPRNDAVFRVALEIDEAIGGLACTELSYPALLARLLGESSRSSETLGAVAALDRLLRKFGSAALKSPPRLGACPAVVFKALTLLQREQVTLTEIEKVAGYDPILATSLLSFANSSLFARTLPVCTLAAATAYIGVPAAKRVILAASARPLFASAELRELWQHSVDVAAIAEQIASSTGVVDPSEAFVAGLIHDIGRLALDLTNQGDFLNTHRRLASESGCAILADTVLTGQDHGQIGATLLSGWRMPDELVDAVRFHHRPELHSGRLSSILYLAEFISDSTEDIPSPERLECAMKTAGVETLDSVKSDLRRLGTALAMVG